MVTRYFKGFSSRNFTKTRNATLYDIDLVNCDLMNHFMTRVGERVMRPDWGCRIWEWLMEPLTPTLRDNMVAEAIRVCQADTRLNVLNVQVYDLPLGVRVEIELQYIPWNVTQTFAANFEIRTAAVWGGSITN
jgi:phage baseplate assembly protein W